MLARAVPARRRRRTLKPPQGSQRPTRARPASTASETEPQAAPLRADLCLEDQGPAESRSIDLQPEAARLGDDGVARSLGFFPVRNSPLELESQLAKVSRAPETMRETNVAGSIQAASTNEHGAVEGRRRDPDRLDVVPAAQTRPERPCDGHGKRWAVNEGEVPPFMDTAHRRLGTDAFPRRRQTERPAQGLPAICHQEAVVAVEGVAVIRALETPGTAVSASEAPMATGYDGVNEATLTDRRASFGARRRGSRNQNGRSCRAS